MGRRPARSGASKPPLPPAANGGGEDFREDEENEEIDAGSKVHILQPNRDPVANWEVDLAKNLEEYLLKICSGELATDLNHGIYSVNFAEAALLLQGSAQVYSRKVEYLYTLVLRALEFIKSEKRQDLPEDSTGQPNRDESATLTSEDNEHFLGLDDVPEDTKSCLSSSANKEDGISQVLKPPANLVVLEGDCLDTSGEGGELESYLLSTCNFYGHFLLLDPIDAGAVQNLLKGKGVSTEQIEHQRGSSVKSKAYNPFASPVGRSGGSRHKSSIKKKRQEVEEEPLDNNSGFGNPYQETCFIPDMNNNSPHGFVEQDFECSGDVVSSEDDDDDPWKPLNPHDSGNLKVKPFKKAKSLARKQLRRTKKSMLAHDFPVAKPNEMISTEFTEALRLYPEIHNKAETPQSPPLFEKLRQSLIFEEHNAPDGKGGTENDSNDGVDDFLDNEHEDFDERPFEFSADLDVDTYPKHAYDNPQSSEVEIPGNDFDPEKTLGDLCRLHLDTLLASIAETEKQTELATRVSNWKHTIESSLEEQDSHKPFDIHLYGENFLEGLSSSVDFGGSMCFTDLVKGQEKYNITRTFSAMLQLVNNGNIELVREVAKNKSTCYTAANPFFVKLLSVGENEEGVHELASKKRVKPPSIKACSDGIPSPALSPPTKTKHRNGKTLKLAKANKVNSTPGSKKRRTPRLIRQVEV